MDVILRGIRKNIVFIMRYNTGGLERNYKETI